MSPNRNRAVDRGFRPVPVSADSRRFATGRSRLAVRSAAGARTGLACQTVSRPLSRSRLRQKTSVLKTIEVTMPGGAQNVPSNGRSARLQRCDETVATGRPGGPSPTRSATGTCTRTRVRSTNRPPQPARGRTRRHYSPWGHPQFSKQTPALTEAPASVMLRHVLTKWTAREESLSNEVPYETECYAPVAINPPPAGVPPAKVPRLRRSLQYACVTEPRARKTRPRRMAVRCHLEGDNLPGKVLLFQRSNGRMPVQSFLDGLTPGDRRKFQGNFMVFVDMGKEHENPQRLKPLRGKGKPLWEFKEHDHRIYCYRRIVGECAYAVLLFGWTKDKGGIHNEETRSIERAQSYRAEAEVSLQRWLDRRR